MMKLFDATVLLAIVLAVSCSFTLSGCGAPDKYCVDVEGDCSYADSRDYSNEDNWNEESNWEETHTNTEGSYNVEESYGDENTL